MTITWLNPFIVKSLNYLLLSNIFTILEPIWLYDSTSMLGITTSAALILLGENNVSLLIDY